MRTFKALVKREYWENKSSMFFTPVVMAAVFAVLVIVALLNANNMTVNGDHYSILNKMPQLIAQLDQFSQSQIERHVQMALYVPITIFSFVLFLVSIFYCLGSLYDERKDRSILFWKSLPISDTGTVLSKFATVSLVYPMFFFVALVVFQFYLLILGTVLLWFGGDSGLILWSSSNFFGVVFNSLSGMLVLSCWLAPIWGWLMFASVWAKRMAFLWGTLPIALIAIAEGTIFNSINFIEMLGQHIGRGFIAATASINNLEQEGSLLGLDLVHPLEALTVGSFWIGLGVAAVFLAVSIYIRRFRDES